jgi:3-oxoacyl-[acyl-carrier protein] reductase
MDMGLKGKKALVAGASKGLGRAVAEGLAAEGCDLTICARSSDTLNKTAQEIRGKYAVQVNPLTVDLSEPRAPGKLVHEAIALYGRLDVLVTNAGGPPAGGFDDFSEEDWLKAVRLTLLSALDMARAALPGMREKGWGRIINMTSISVKQPVDGLLLSNSIRAAVVGWAKTLSDAEGKNGITVNNICPGYFLTERVTELMEKRSQSLGISVEQAMQQATQDIALGRMGDPREYGDLAVFLASERASYITGVSYLIDGGWYRGMM